MKDGRTHLAHKAEHAVDLSSGAIVAVTLLAADQGDTTTVHETLKEARTNARLVNERGVEELVADKGYHSGATLAALHGESVRTYILEPERGRRQWQGRETEQPRVYANRRRVQGRRGKQLQKLRSELTERSFAHMYETGGLRRCSREQSVWTSRNIQVCNLYRSELNDRTGRAHRVKAPRLASPGQEVAPS
jgi:transposase